MSVVSMMEFPVTDNTILLRKLAAIASTASVLEDGSRAISNGTWPQPISAILDEIDDTVLKRRLFFANGSNHLSMVVSGRRLLMIDQTTEDFDGKDDMLNQPLSSEEADKVRTVAELLAKFAQHDGRLTVKSEAAEAVSGPTDSGVSVSTLAEVMGIDLSEEPEDPVQQFIEATSDLMNSCLYYVDGEEVGENGDETEISKLRSILSDEWEAFRKNLPSINLENTGPFLIGLSDAIGDAITLFVASAGQTLVAFTSSDEDAPAVHDRWSTYFVV